MSDTYNLGRVVGWSTYEQFIKDHDIDPSVISEEMYQAMVSYGVARKVELSKAGWNGTTILTQTVKVPGAVWGVVPIVGAYYDKPKSTAAAEVEKNEGVRKVLSSIFSCVVTGSSGTPASGPSSTNVGYLTFCALPEAKDVELDNFTVIVRGLGIEAMLDNNYYLGPEGLVMGSGGDAPQPAFLNFNRSFPVGADPVDVDMDPVIDMRSYSPEIYYSDDDYGACVVKADVKVNKPISSDTGLLSIYQYNAFMAPALYAAAVEGDATGEIELCPIDVTAPGTVKLLTMKEGYDIGDLHLRMHHFEHCLPCNYSMGKEYGSAVWYQLDGDRTSDNASDNEMLPISDDVTEATGGLMEYHTRNLWFFGMHAGGGDPTFEDLQSVTGIEVVTLITGYFSQEFLDEYGIPGNDIPGLGTVFGSAVTGYINQVPESERANYYGILTSTSSQISGETQQLSTWLVDKRTGLIATAVMYNYNLQGLKKGFDFTHGALKSGGATTYSHTVTDYMGSWWNRWGGSTDDLVSFWDADGNAIGTDHPKVKVAATEAQYFYQPHAAAAKAPEGYNNVAADWFASTSMEKVMQDFGTTFEEMGIHDDYQGDTLLEFLQDGAMYNLSQPKVSTNKLSHSTGATHYLFPKSSLPPTGTTTSTWNGYVMRPGMKVEVPSSAINFFAPKSMTFKLLSTDSSGSLVTGRDVTSKVRRASNTIWTAKGKSGRHETSAVSLVDSNGALLPLRGTSGSMTTDLITWDQLLKGLNQNQSIDILEGLKDAKKAIVGGDKGYITIRDANDNETRLYVSKTAPTGDIPVGSIGMGW